jgi:hypothetical protein
LGGEGSTTIDGLPVRVIIGAVDGTDVGSFPIDGLLVMTTGAADGVADGSDDGEDVGFAVIFWFAASASDALV